MLVIPARLYRCVPLVVVSPVSLQCKVPLLSFEKVNHRVIVVLDAVRGLVDRCFPEFLREVGESSVE